MIAGVDRRSPDVNNPSSSQSTSPMSDQHPPASGSANPSGSGSASGSGAPPAAGKAIASLAKKQSDVTRLGAQRLKFVPTLPPRRVKE